MVEKVKALCDAIDTLNSLPLGPNTDARLAELSEMLLAECKQMVTPPAIQVPQPYSERVYTAGNDIEPGDPLLIVGDKVYSTAARPATPPTKESIEQRRQDIARATLLREMGETNGDIPTGKKIYPDLGLPRLP